ncbi:Hemerythrin HHE cation binding domain-containing protein [Thiohalospira halophila DSM 15071]|uniref:Hemerythrin HHE cation binding domain-containing protein n=1 Tax=Thiohalospira halophila DSM 15071 TaxID=1123397 RepID=A0A1I1Q6A8_9GAMM|nr:hemerythrin domain-containing protein [Thiohalospira halophila]SFD17579.1 Hemerythrin HHE cation binding domain-containing protein [Thiohalospira halophila DSM 15071]
MDPDSLLGPAAPGPEDPLGFWAACHRRMLENIATLERLAGHLRHTGVDDQAAAAADRVRRYFNEAAPRHHADEEEDLFPRLRSACPGDRALHAELDDLAGGHGELDRAWATLEPALAAIAEGHEAILEPAEYVATVRDHVAREDEVVAPRLRAALTADDLRAAGTAMAARRGLAPPV